MMATIAEQAGQSVWQSLKKFSAICYAMGREIDVKKTRQLNTRLLLDPEPKRNTYSSIFTTYEVMSDSGQQLFFKEFDVCFC